MDKGREAEEWRTEWRGLSRHDGGVPQNEQLMVRCAVSF